MQFWVDENADFVRILNPRACARYVARQAPLADASCGALLIAKHATGRLRRGDLVVSRGGFQPLYSRGVVNVRDAETDLADFARRVWYW